MKSLIVALLAIGAFLALGGGDLTRQAVGNTKTFLTDVRDDLRARQQNDKAGGKDGDEK